MCCWAISQYLPTGGFRWLTEKQIDTELMKEDYIHPYGDKRYIFEVDLEYPGELHELHNDYPVATEKMKVSPDMLSPYCKMIKEKYGISIGQVAKLIPTNNTNIIGSDHECH